MAPKANGDAAGGPPALRPEASFACGSASLAPAAHLHNFLIGDGTPDVSDAERRARRTDRFGFIVSGAGANDRCAHARDQTPREKDKEAARARKWAAMLAHWDRFGGSGAPGLGARTLKRRARKGIPDAVRGQAWLRLSGAAAMKARDRKQNGGRDLYAELLAKEDGPAGFADAEEAIVLDVRRTLPNHARFRSDSRRGRTGQQGLYNVLRCHALHDPELGYCQGMGYVTALFLLYVDEADAFWMLRAVIEKGNASPCCPDKETSRLRGLYVPGMEKVHEAQAVGDGLLAKLKPKLHQHLKTLNVMPGLYATPWYVTLLVKDYPLDVVTRLWDAMLSEGWKAVHRFAIALLDAGRTELLRAKDMEGALGFLQNELPHRVDPEKLVRDAFRLGVKREQIEALTRDHRAGVRTWWD